MKVLIYTKDNCSYCVKAKTLLMLRDIQYTECVIGQDILREDFIALFPEQKSVPLIIINDEKVGGYDDLAKYFDAQR